MRYKYVLLGVKDYIKDCWHDFWFRFWNSLWDFSRRRTFRCYDWRNNEGCYTKEGSVWHYIYNRKVAAARKAFSEKYGHDLAEALEDFKLEDIEKMPEVEVVEIGTKRDV